MAKQRYISSDFWVDPYIQDLDTAKKLLYIYLFTNDHVDLCGIYEITLKTISFESGIGFETVSKALKDFERDGKILYKDGYICLKNFKKHLKTNPNIQKGVERSLALIPSDILKAFESLSKGSLPIPILIPIPKPNGITQVEKNKDSEKEKKVVSEIIDFLNKTTNSNFKETTKETIKKINGRLADGYTVDDFKKVIKTKSEEWMGTSYSKHLNPDTLFRPSNFEKYLNQKNEKTQNDYKKEYLEVGFSVFKQKYGMDFAIEISDLIAEQ